MNLVVVGTAGYSISTVPDDVKLLLYELAWLFFKAPPGVAVASISKPNISKQLTLKLSDVNMQTLNGLKVWGQPE